MEAAASFSGNEFLQGEMLRRLTIGTEGDLSLVWAPFEHICKTARVAVVGICPGRTQAENALRAFRSAMQRGLGTREALRQAKLTGSFSGPMRANFVDMLDHIGLNEALRVQSCWRLFEPESEFAHFTSAVRYPAFIGDANYAGKPEMLRTSLLRGVIDTALVEEATRLPHALWVPLGPVPAAALKHLASEGWLRNDQILEGLPHPSGANAERISYFLGRKRREALSPKTNALALDLARESLMRAVERWCRQEKAVRETTQARQ
jgi:hypothetical protein